VGKFYDNHLAEIVASAGRFNKFVEVADNGRCWKWTGIKSGNGYGQFWFNGANRPAHTMSYIIYKKMLPKKEVIMHTCDNPLCVNPTHLLDATYSENNQDRYDKGRDNKEYGEAHHNASLTEKEVVEIRTSTDRNKYLCAKYKVSAATICDIQKRRTWRHV